MAEMLASHWRSIKAPWRAFEAPRSSARELIERDKEEGKEKNKWRERQWESRRVAAVTDR